MDRILLFIIATVILSATDVLAQRFFIGCWFRHGQATFQNIAEAVENGFSLIISSGNIEENKKTLTWCSKNGVQAVLVDDRIVSSSGRRRDYARILHEVVSDYGFQPALWGYYVKDEPSTRDFRWLSSVNKLLTEKDRERILLINLPGNNRRIKQLGKASYEEYIDEFCRVVRPRIISFKSYAPMPDSDKTDLIENLEIIRRQSIKHSIPFCCVFVLSLQGSSRNHWKDDLRQQIYTCLAYGARGLIYRCSEAPDGTEPEHSEATSSAEEAISATYEYENTRQINAEVMKLAQTLARLKCMAVYHAGDIPLGTKALPEKGLISKISDGEFVIGQFDSNTGQKYALLVNRNARSVTRASVHFSQKVRLWEVSPLTGRLRPIVVYDEGAGSRWNAIFEAGQGRLLLIDTPQNLPILHWQDIPKFRPRVMLNPSCQFANVIRGPGGEELYNEGLNMYDIALKVRDELLRDGRVDVFISRSARDQAVSLRYETELTRSLNCDVLVSLHSDATGDGTPGGGTWTFYADENEGKRLAECVQIPLLEAIRTFYPEVQFRGIRTHWYRLWVLWEAGCPASLTEVLFHTNPREREMLKDPKLQDIMAKAIARGILNYLGLS
jgi:hypothetical protein